MSYIVAFQNPANAQAFSLLRRLNAGMLHPTCWLVDWSGTARSLIDLLNVSISSSVVVCRADSDWDFR